MEWFQFSQIGRGHMLAGLRVDEHTIVAAPTVRQLFEILLDPMKIERNGARSALPRERAMAALRDEIQRRFVRSRAANVESYKDYLLDLPRGRDGAAPSLHVWVREALEFRPFSDGDDGMAPGIAVVPYDAVAVAIDGETQWAARIRAAEQDPTQWEAKVPVVLMHGRAEGWAKQVFADFARLGLRVRPSLAESRDHTSDLGSLVAEVIRSIPELEGAIEHKARQPTGNKLMTMSALRTMVLGVAIGAPAFHKKSAPSLSADALPRITSVATQWIGTWLKRHREQIRQRDAYLHGAPAMLAAIGAIGHVLVVRETQDIASDVQRLLSRFNQVDYRRGAHWDGIAGHLTRTGRLVLHGTRQAARPIHTALTDPQSWSHNRIRHQAPQPQPSA